MKVFIAFLILLISCNNATTEEITPSQKNNSNAENKQAFTLIRQYPHDTNAFLEGLEFFDSTLYESCGDATLYENISDASYICKSKIATIDLKTGKEILKTNLGKPYFGEGVTIINGKAYMLTYKEEKCFVFEAKTLKNIKQLNYKGEGWGMTNNGKQIINSNGTNNIYFRNAETFAEENVLAIFDENGPVSNINELEYINGFIYANKWMTNYILKIDPKSGKVIKTIDFSSLVNQYIPENLRIEMNGIAYNKFSKTFFITGKKWPIMFEVSIQ